MSKKNPLKFSVKGEMDEIKKNTGSVRGNFKNALKLSKVAPTPTSKIIVFLLVFFIPMILGFILFFGFLIIASGAMVSVLVHDPDVVKEFQGGSASGSNPSDGGSSLSRIDVPVPAGLEGKFLLTWNLGQITSVQSPWRCIAECGPHRGVDLQPMPLPAYSGSQPKEQKSLYLYPVYPGEVIFSSNNFKSKSFIHWSYGNVVVVRHDIEGKNYYSVYAHLFESFVKEGDIVDYFDKIGRMGCTGRSYGHFLGCGAHLHFEIRGPEFYNGTRFIYGSGELQVGSLISCGANGETMKNTVGSKLHCVKYTEEVLGGKPNELK